MFISKLAPISFVSGDILSPEALNENNNYFRKAFQYEADKQTARWTSTYSLCPDLSTSLTSASPAAYLTRRIPPSSFRARTATPPVTIESFSITVFYTATAEFSMSIASGAETITFPIRDASLATEPYQVVRLMNITSTTDTLFTVTLPAGVTITKFDVTVGFASDRYLSGNDSAALTKPTLTLPEFTDSVSADASIFTGLKTAVETAATAAKAGIPFRWIAIDFHDITSATNLRYRGRVVNQAFASPSFTSLIGAARVVGLWADIQQSVIGAGNNVVQLQTVTGASIAGITDLNIAVGASVQGGQMAATPVRNSAVDSTANDHTIRISTPAGNTITRATIYVLLQ